MDTLDQHEVCNVKYTRANNLTFMARAFSKDAMKRTRLPLLFLKSINRDDKKSYMKQWNYFVSMLRRKNPKCYAKLDEKNITGDKTFWMVHVLSSLFVDNIGNL